MNLSKKNKWILNILVLSCIAFYAVYRYAYKPHKTIEKLEIEYTGTSLDFIEKVKEDTSIWNNKIVLLSGIITSKEDKGITLNNGIYCQFREVINSSKLKEGSPISLKGRVIGYDDLLEELKLDQCIIQD
jgi:hypothetical protein